MKEKFYFSTGTIDYRPDGWIILKVSPSIVNYYKFWIEKFIGKKISTSYHTPHVTILPAKHNGDFTKHPLWNKYQGKRVEFKYFSDILTDHDWFFMGTYYWLRVECPFIGILREELGLPPKLKWPAHVTVGYRGY